MDNEDNDGDDTVVQTVVFLNSLLPTQTHYHTNLTLPHLSHANVQYNVSSSRRMYCYLLLEKFSVACSHWCVIFPFLKKIFRHNLQALCFMKYYFFAITTREESDFCEWPFRFVERLIWELRVLESKKTPESKLWFACINGWAETVHYLLSNPDQPLNPNYSQGSDFLCFFCDTKNTFFDWTVFF